MGLGWKSLKALILRAPLCGANKQHKNNIKVVHALDPWEFVTKIKWSENIVTKITMIGVININSISSVMSSLRNTATLQQSSQFFNFSMHLRETQAINKQKTRRKDYHMAERSHVPQHFVISQFLWASYFNWIGPIPFILLNSFKHFTFLVSADATDSPGSDFAARCERGSGSGKLWSTSL